jgi:hypothetical protein
MRAHWIWYLFAMISTVGMFAGWQWIRDFGFTGWFPFFAVTMGQLVRARSDLPPDMFDRAFRSMRAETLAIGSLVLIVAGIAIWAAWLNYFEMPRQRAESIEQFKREWKESGRAAN